jgi:uncharacterized membrane protein YbaN (DUF454 family)
MLTTQILEWEEDKSIADTWKVIAIALILFSEAILVNLSQYLADSLNQTVNSLTTVPGILLRN